MANTSEKDQINSLRKKILSKPSEIDAIFNETLDKISEPIYKLLASTIQSNGSFLNLPPKTNHDKKFKRKPSSHQTILYIDDEIDNLLSFKAIFRNDFKILTALDFDGMEDILKEEKVDIVISDLKMKFKDGICVLEYVKNTYPEIKRFLTSGFINKETSEIILKKDVASDCFEKPWRINDMKIAFK